LLIGTFSNALNIVPRAGLWMVEVKKLFGFLLLSMCFYYLSNILPWYIILWMIASTLFIAGIWYVVTVADYYSRGMRWYRYIFGTLLLLGSFLLFYQALKATLTIAEPPARCIATTYDEGRAKAIIENKLMLVDFGAQWCTACKEIEHRFFANQWVLDQLKDLIIVQVDFTNPEAETCKIIQKQYKIIGFPTVLLVEPQEQNVIARWGGELLDLSKEDFVELVKKHYSSSSS
jgi:thioredoxin:protein disulfide reductase